MSKPAVVMVTGPRELSYPDVVRERLQEVLTRLEPSVAVSGGAEGADTLFAEAALDAGTRLLLMLPNRWYRKKYPRSVPDEVVQRANRVEAVVDRPDVADWRARWDTERWWRDNFARNGAMVEVSDLVVVVSRLHPVKLVGMDRGGTAACLRQWRTRHPQERVLWVPDDPAVGMRYTKLAA